MHRLVAFLAMVLAALIAPAGLRAHFNLNLNVRIFHVEHLDQGLHIYLRTPMPYLIADRMGPVGADGLPAAAPFTINRLEGDRLMHLVDWAALRQGASGLGQIAADALQVHFAGERLTTRVADVRVHRIGSEPGFATRDEARAVFGTERSSMGAATETYVGDAVVDVLLILETGADTRSYTLGSTLDPGLPDQEETANLILDYGSGGTGVYRVRGLMAEPVAITGAPAAAVLTFVIEGARHILEGFDHVLFVICIVLGTTGIRSLISRITGFTLGHSVTLTAGFLGYVPAGGWFVPLVEAGIAMSIIYAGAIALLPESRRGHSERNMFIVVCAIGLLHGLGFSFVLHRILKIDAPNLWESLVAFNVGVELGQLAIVAVVLLAFVVLRRIGRGLWDVVRAGAACACVVIASVWTVQRVLLLVTMA